MKILKLYTNNAQRCDDMGKQVRALGVETGTYNAFTDTVHVLGMDYIYKSTQDVDNVIYKPRTKLDKAYIFRKRGEGIPISTMDRIKEITKEVIYV